MQIRLTKLREKVINIAHDISEKVDKKIAAKIAMFAEKE